MQELGSVGTTIFVGQLRVQDFDLGTPYLAPLGARVTQPRLQSLRLSRAINIKANFRDSLSYILACVPDSRWPYLT